MLVTGPVKTDNDSCIFVKTAMQSKEVMDRSSSTTSEGKFAKPSTCMSSSSSAASSVPQTSTVMNRDSAGPNSIPPYESVVGVFQCFWTSMLAFMFGESLLSLRRNNLRKGPCLPVLDSSATESMHPPTTFTTTQDQTHDEDQLLSFFNARDELFSFQHQRMEDSETKDALLQNSFFNSSMELPSSQDFEVIPHFRQYTNWDCGIACLILVLRWIRLSLPPSSSSVAPEVSSQPTNFPDDSTLLPEEVCEREWILQRVATKSVWTADIILLLYEVYSFLSLLPRCLTVSSKDVSEMKGRAPPTTLTRHANNGDVGHDTNGNNARLDNCAMLFCSKALDVNDDHSNLGYYQHTFTADQQRVASKFRLLQQLQVPMLCLDDMPFSDVIDTVVKKNCIAILLLDNSKFYPKRSATATDNSSSNESTDTYAGHYVILTGISKNTKHLQEAQQLDRRFSIAGTNDVDLDYCCAVINPGIKEQISFVSPGRVAAAWKAPGTDNDIIFIVKGMCL